MYAAFSRGAMLNPDEEQDGEGEFYYNESEVTGGAIDMSELEDALLEVRRFIIISFLPVCCRVLMPASSGGGRQRPL